MAQKAHSLSHTKWLCKHRIVFTPKYRRKVIYSQIRKDVGEILRRLCEYKGIEVIEGRLMPGHSRMPAPMPPKRGVPDAMGCLKGKSSLMMFDKHANLKHEFGNRKFWAEGCCATAVGLNEATIAKHVREQEAHDIALDKLSVREYEDPFGRGRPSASRFDRPATGQRQSGLNRVKASAFRRWPASLGLRPKSKPPAMQEIMICRCMV